MLGLIVVSIRPDKVGKYILRLTVGGYLLQNIMDVSTPTANLGTVKIFVNSVILTSNAKCILANVI